MHSAPTPTVVTTYRPDIDGLRAVAVLLVLVFHFQLVPWGRAGFIGVDVFFVISGFLITTIVRAQLEDGRFGLRAFYIGRVRRLAPALLATLMLTLVAGLLLLMPIELRELSNDVLWSQLYGANIYYWRYINYFGLSADDAVLLHTWSLCVEEQFYLLYPLTVMALHRWARRWFWPAIGMLLVLSFALNLAFVQSKPQATFYLLPTRAWELLAGALTAWATQRLPRSGRVNSLLGLGGFAAIVWAVVAHRLDTPFPGWFALLPVAGGVALILAGDGAPNASSRLLGARAMVYVGQISYPLYLVHWPVNVLARQVLSDSYGLAWRGAMFGLSFALAAAIYHAFEQPVRARRALPTSTALLRAYGAGLAATLALFAVVQGSVGLPQRFSPRVVELASYVNDISPPLAECEFGRNQGAKDAILGLCAIGAHGQAPRWLVYGDSHAWAAHAAFDRWLEQRGEAGLFVFRNSCLPLTGIHVVGDGGRCWAFNEAVHDHLRRHAEIDHVVLVSTWRQALEGKLGVTPDRALGGAPMYDLFEQRFDATLASLRGMGKRIYIWEPVPGARQSVPYAMAQAERSGKPLDIEFTIDEYRNTFAFFFDALARNRALVQASFSPSQALCGSGRCAVSLAGAPLYADNAHITRSAFGFWVGVLMHAVPAHEP